MSLLELALAGCVNLPPSPQKAYFYTGNRLRFVPLPVGLPFVMDKAAMAHFIFDCTVAYRDTEYKFNRLDEGFSDGAAAKEASNGDALAEMMLELVNSPV